MFSIECLINEIDPRVFRYIGRGVAIVVGTICLVQELDYAGYSVFDTRSRSAQ